MKSILKFSSMFAVIIITIIASMFILDMINIDVARDMVFRSVFLVLTLTIASLLISVIVGEKKKIR